MNKTNHSKLPKSPLRGWQCPVCGCVWNLLTKGCDFCNSIASHAHFIQSNTKTNVEYVQ